MCRSWFLCQEKRWSTIAMQTRMQRMMSKLFEWIKRFAYEFIRKYKQTKPNKRMHTQLNDSEERIRQRDRVAQEKKRNKRQRIIGKYIKNTIASHRIECKLWLNSKHACHYISLMFVAIAILNAAHVTHSVFYLRAFRYATRYTTRQSNDERERERERSFRV